MKISGKQKPQCPNCGQTDESKFRLWPYKKVSGKIIYYWSSWCKDCTRNKPEYKETQKRSRRRTRRRYRAEYRREFERADFDLKCSKCGYKDNWYALDWHHLNPKEKKFNIGSLYKLKPTKE